MIRIQPIVVTAALMAGVAAPATAFAHMGSTKEVALEVEGAEARARVEVDAVDAAVALGLGLDPSQEVLDRHAGLVSGWLGQGLVLSTDGRPCRAEAGEPVLGVGPDAKIALPITYACPTAAATLTLRDATVFEEDPEHRTFVRVAIDGVETTHVLRAGAQRLEVPRGSGASATVASFLEEGAVHLVTGYDHLLFLLSLILVAGLTVQRRGLRPAVTDVAWVVTAFTLGHSVSLGAAALGVVRLGGQWVEVAIAASIVVVALLNVFRPKMPTAATRKTRAAIAAAFGVVHGFGFSSVLADVGLPPGDRVLALLSFNVGIELAQLALVVLVMLPLSIASRRPSYERWVVQGGSLAIAAIGCIWVAQRSIGG